MTYTSFAQSLIHDLAVPVLSEGYADLVRKLRQNEQLARLVGEVGLSAVLDGDSPELASLRKKNKEVVTGQEKEAERRMAEAVKARFPEQSIVGEEHGYKPGSSTRWVFDPIDGTSAMIRTAMAEAYGVPVGDPVPSFGVTVGVTEGDLAVAGVVTELRPHNGGLIAVATWVGEIDQRSTCNISDTSPLTPTPLPPSQEMVGEGLSSCFPDNEPSTRKSGGSPSPPVACNGGRGVGVRGDVNISLTTLAESRLATTVPEIMFNTPEKWSGFQALLEATGKPCVTDQNCIGFMRLCEPESGITIAYEADLAYHDAAALVPILECAGLVVTDDVGQPLKFPESAIGQEFRILAACPALHKLALAKIQTGVPPEANTFKTGGNIHQGYAQKFQ